MGTSFYFCLFLEDETIPVSSLNCSTEVFSTFIDNDYQETHWQVIKVCDFNAIDYHTKTVLSIEYA